MIEEKFQTLKTPPLEETALCVTFSRDNFSREEVERIAREIAPGFGRQCELHSQNVTYTVGPTPQMTTEKVWGGMRFVKDKNLVLTLQNVAEGKVVFAFSILPPYVSWNDFESKALPVYERFFERFMKQCPVLRIGLRSIDKIVCPQEVCQLSDIIKTVPPDVEGLETPTIRRFAYRETLYYPKLALHATVSRTDGPIVGERNSIILDTDIFDLPNGRPLTRSFVDLLSAMHHLRDKIFFGTVTEDILKGFGHE